MACRLSYTAYKTLKMITAVKSIFAVLVLLAGLSTGASAQDIKAGSYTKSTVTVVTTENKTNISVSNFPKQTRVVIFDSEDNLISIISTNNTGAASITLPKTVSGTVYAKTLNGEILVSNKLEQDNENAEGLASKDVPASNKA